MAQFDWSLYLAVATHLLGQRREEYSRAAISRAYYGAFCTARERLETIQRSRFPNMNVHQAVINRLSGDSRPEFKQAGSDLDRLRQMRNKADYDSNIVVTTNEASLAVALARSLAAEISKLRS